MADQLPFRAPDGHAPTMTCSDLTTTNAPITITVSAGLHVNIDQASSLLAYPRRAPPVSGSTGASAQSALRHRLAASCVHRGPASVPASGPAPWSFTDVPGDTWLPAGANNQAAAYVTAGRLYAAISWSSTNPKEAIAAPCSSRPRGLRGAIARPRRA